MPLNLKKLHEENDLLIESLYKKNHFINDDEKVKKLFDMYTNLNQSLKLI